MGIGGWYVYTMVGIGEKTYLWTSSEIRRFLVFCVFGVDCNYTDNLENRLWVEKWQKRRYSLVAGRKTNRFVDCASFNKRYLLVRFINLFRLCTKYISRFYVSFRFEPMIEPMIELINEPMIELINELMIELINEPIQALKYTIVTIE